MKKARLLKDTAMKDTGKVYSDKLGLRMLYLNQLEHASEAEIDNTLPRHAREVYGSCE